MKKKKSQRELANFDWYSSESTRANLPPRCPFASIDHCPKYFESLSVLDQGEITASLNTDDTSRLKEKWKNWRSPTMEQSSTWAKSARGIMYVSNICPDIGFDIFGHFAAAFHWYGDEIDWDLAQKRLSKSKADAGDPRWKWATVFPEHYTECRLYSILSVLTVGPRSNRVTRTRIPSSLRFTVLTRDAYTCVYCGKKAQEARLEVDHRVSEAEGGKTTLENLVTACSDCNKGKGIRSARI